MNKITAFVLGILLISICGYSQTSYVRISISPNVSISSQQSSDIIIYNGTKTSDLSTGDVTCSLSTEGNDLIYDINYSGHDFDKDEIVDTLFCQLRVKGYTGSSVSYSESAASSSVTLGTTSASVENTFSFWGVNGAAETTVNDIDLGETVSFQIESQTIKYSGAANYSATSKIVSAFINETNGGYGHMIIEGLGENLNSYITNLSVDVPFSDNSNTVYLTGAGSTNATNTLEWGVQKMTFLITCINNDNPYYWDLEDYSSYSTGPSYAGINYPASWMDDDMYPCFSWEHIPQYLTFKSGDVQPDENYEIAAEYSLVGVGGSSHGADTWDEGMWNVNTKLKSYNPLVKTDFYMNSQIVFPWYLHTDEFYTHPEWIGPDTIRGYNTYNHADSTLRQFWVDNVLNGINYSDVDAAFIDKSSSLPSPLYDSDGVPCTDLAKSIDLLYKSKPANKYILGNVLRNESDGGNRSAMQIYDGSYLERWATPNSDYAQTEAEAFAVSIQLMREALMKGKIIELRNDDEVLNETGELTQQYFYTPLAGFLMAVEKNGFYGYQGSILIDDDNYWDTRDLEYFSNYLGAPLGPPVKDGLKYSRSFENLDVTLDLSAGDDLASAITTFTWKGMKVPEPIYDYKSNTFLATIDSLSNFTLTENVLNPVRDCDCQSEYVGQLDKAANATSSMRFALTEKMITTLEYGIFRFKVYIENSNFDNGIVMVLKNTNDASPDATKLSLSDTIASNSGWEEFSFDFRNETMLSSEYNVIDIYIEPLDAGSSDIVSCYFESLRGPDLKPDIAVDSVLLSPTGKRLSQGETFTISATVLPSDATDKTITWTSGDTSIVTVSSSGEVTAVGDGRATITASSSEPGKTATCDVTVSAFTSESAFGDYNASAYCQIVKSNATTLCMYVNDDDVSASQGVVLGDYTENDSSSIWVEIDRYDGYYSYQKLGTNYCLDGGDGGANSQAVVLGSCDTSNVNQLWQKEDSGSELFRLKKSDVEFVINGGSTVDSPVNLWKSSSSSSNLKWRFDAVDVLFPITIKVVDEQSDLPISGVSVKLNQTAKQTGSNGETIFTNLAMADYTYEISFNGDTLAGDIWLTKEDVLSVKMRDTLTYVVSSVSVSPVALSLSEGDTSSVTATVLPVYAVNKAVEWSTSDSSIATVSSDGLVTAVKEGLASITVKTIDGDLIATCSVTVTDSPVTSSDESLSSAKFDVYPNPINSLLVIELSNAQQATYSIVTCTGQIVFSGRINNGLVSVDVSGLIPGIYFIRVCNNESVYTKKVIK